MRSPKPVSSKGNVTVTQADRGDVESLAGT
jgi:hypothetical protein